MTKFVTACLCIMVALAGIAAPTATAATTRLSATNSNALATCLQRTYLMRDVYQTIFMSYPSLNAFDTIAKAETATIADLQKVFARYRIAIPPDKQSSAARSIAATVTGDLAADAVGVDLERSTADIMTQLLVITDNADVRAVETAIKTASLGIHTETFVAEQAALAPVFPPAPDLRPFPAPTTTRTVVVPPTIDATGKSDASAALNTFVAGVPDGSIITFPTGTTYQLDQGIQFANRHNLVFVGNGTTLKVGAAVSGSNQLASTFVLGHRYGGFWEGGNTDIAIRDFVLVGNSRTPGVFDSTAEHLASFEVEGSTRVEISDCQSSGYYGDFVKVGDNSASVWVHDNTVPTTGRNGGTIISGRDVIFERNAFGTIGYCIFDIEPNNVSEATYNARFLDNTAVSWDCAFLSVEGSHTGAMIDGVVASGNTVTSDSLYTLVDNGGTARMKNISFTGNTGMKTAAGPVLIFAHVDGLTVADNVQSLSSGTLTKIVDSTGY